MPLLPSKETFRSYVIFFYIFKVQKGEGVSKEIQYDLTSRVNDFQNGEQSVHRRDG